MKMNVITTKTIAFFCLLTSIIMVFSCKKTEEQKKYDYLRKEVMDHYKTDPNPLKEKAALFLLDNLKGSYTIEGDSYKAYTDTIRMYYQKPDNLHKKLVLLKNMPFDNDTVFDTNQLTPRFLINNIDQAFSAWEKVAWKDQISFDIFCEYILPYRIGNEPLEDWRGQITRDSLFQLIGDTLYSIPNLKNAAMFLSIEQDKQKSGFRLKMGENAANIPDLQYSVLNFLTTGTCSNLAQYSLFMGRTGSIPIATDFTPHWANASKGHDWNAIICKSTFIPFSHPIKDTLGNYKKIDRISSKVYRQTFSVNAGSHAMQRGYCKFLPSWFNNPRIIDVTEFYEKTTDIAIPVLSNPDKEKYAYLAVSGRDKWIPLSWGTIKAKSAMFKKTVYPVIYLPVFVSEAGVQEFNAPFIVSTDKSVRFLKPDSINLRSVELTRKYPLSSIIKEHIKRMVNGKFQVADNSDFKDAVTLYTITEDPGVYYNEVNTTLAGKYKYARYLTEGSGRCSVAEIEFYTKNGKSPLKGKAIGSPAIQPFENAFDGNVLTYTEAITDDYCWVGLKFSEPTEIAKIRFVSRNDKNQIIPGNLYQLFYWDSEWKSLGEQIATDNVLVYDRVPSNCLFLLKNHTEGKEERIFTYENGKQVWW